VVLDQQPRSAFARNAIHGTSIAIARAAPAAGAWSAARGGSCSAAAWVGENAIIGGAGSVAAAGGSASTICGAASVAACCRGSACSANGADHSGTAVTVSAGRSTLTGQAVPTGIGADWQH
jgi:hypothetical protein